MDASVIIREWLNPDQPKLDPNELGFNPYREITKLKISIATSIPFFSTFVVSYPTVIMPPNHPLITTAATDGKYFFFNALFMHLLNPNGLDRENGAQKFVFCHEIMHLIYDSRGRRGSRDPQLWNVATDYIINQTLMDFGLEMPTVSAMRDAMIEVSQRYANDPARDDEIAEAVNKVFHRNHTGDYIGLYDTRFHGMTAEQVYELLKKEDEEKESDDCQSGDDDDDKGYSSGSGKGMSLHRDKQTLDVHTIDDLSEEEQKEISRSVRDSTLRAVASERQRTNNKGDIPTGILQVINEFLKPKVPWADLIVAEMDSLRISDYSPLRVDPRFFSGNDITGPMTLPGVEHETKVNIGIMVDTSGSITDEDLRKVLGELQGIIQQFDDFNIDIISCDTRVYNEENYDMENGDELVAYPFRGGGGTEFAPAFERMKELNESNDEPFDALIYFTDGYCGGYWGEEYQDYFTKMIWVIVQGYENSAPVPSWGTTIYYDQYE